MAKVSELQASKAALIEFGAAAFAMAGQSECGDLYVVESRAEFAMVAAVDGGGHGREAAHAARIAAATVRRHAGEEVSGVIKLCHLALRRTRGAVMSLAVFDGRRDTMTWLGVGNVEGVILRSAPCSPWRRETLFLRGGVLGLSLPPLRPATVRVGPGDVLVFATDGIHGLFDRGLSLSDPPQVIAERICLQHGRSTDDRLAMVVRYLGSGCDACPVGG